MGKPGRPKGRWDGREVNEGGYLSLPVAADGLPQLKKTGIKGASASTVWPWGTFNSSTMIVIMMAKTPSLKASNLFLPIQSSLFSKDTFPALMGGKYPAAKILDKASVTFTGIGPPG